MNLHSRKLTLLAAAVCAAVTAGAVCPSCLAAPALPEAAPLTDPSSPVHAAHVKPPVFLAAVCLSEESPASALCPAGSPAVLLRLLSVSDAAVHPLFLLPAPEPDPYASTGAYIWPTVGVLTSNFGSRSEPGISSNHQGIDIGNSVGTQVHAADAGEVVYAGSSSGGYGNLIKILHDNGDITYYAHLNNVLVSVGDRVSQGELIAQMGRTGNVTGPHLHFELRPNGGSPVNPLTYLTGELLRT